ncbi:hypothetical protein M514_05714 [Trichuris suis]|uniref:Uncharacterized protein n=1 Tax=Trichuris suis TaxID=68888 RepID=A0A085M8A4_9BILA|nr:hypothetical protein M513_05714 [Trichuris suis]KFD66481.1 hypothetical protein M514_05714 [Trichuris suis]KHJ49035.1 hypothetical protein D918_00153 [Trichuris suis]
MDLARKAFEKKRKELLDEIRQVEEGTHPELLKQVNAIEEEYDRWVNVEIPLMREQMERDAQLRYEAAIELAKKGYSVGSVLAKRHSINLQFQESFEEMREKLLHQLKEERAEIERDYYYDELDSSDGLLLPPPRKLRPRFSDVAPPCDIEQKTPTSLRALNTSLSKGEIEQCLSDIRTVVANAAENEATQEPGFTTAVAINEQLGESTVATCSQRQSPPSTCSSKPNLGVTVTEFKSEQSEQLSATEVHSPQQETYKVGKRVIVLGPRGIIRATIAKVELDCVTVITEQGNRLIPIEKHDIENRTYIFDPPGVIRILRKAGVYEINDQADEEIGSTSEVASVEQQGGSELATSVDSGDTKNSAASCPQRLSEPANCSSKPNYGSVEFKMKMEHKGP